MERKKATPAPVVGRRIGGGFEIDSVVAAQHEEAVKFRERKAQIERQSAEQARSAELNQETKSINDHPQQILDSTSLSENRSPHVRIRLPAPAPRIHKQLTVSIVPPADAKRQMKRRQECLTLGFPALWSYSQTQIACEQLSRGVSEMAFAHGGEKIFSTSNVLHAYKEMNLSCLQDPLLSQMIARLQQKQEKSKHDDSGENDGNVDEEGSSESDIDERLGVEHLALPPHEMKTVDPLTDMGPVAVPAADAVETILAHAKLSTSAERRGSESVAALSSLHKYRAASLNALLNAGIPTKVLHAVMRPVSRSDDAEATANTTTHSCAIHDAVRILFWFVFASFFHHDLLGVIQQYFPKLSEALVSIEMSVVAMKHLRLAPNGEVDHKRDAVGVVQHTDNQSTPIDFLPFVLIHAVCFLFPAVFPASHDIFTVDFFNRASMLMNLILNGTESDAQYWQATRKQFFDAPEITVDDVANAAEIARVDSDKLLQRYQDDVSALLVMRQQELLKSQSRFATSDAGVKRKQVNDSGHLPPSSNQLAKARSSGNLLTQQQDSRHSSYTPPLSSFELGDPVFHLLNESIYDAEYAQELIRQRNQAYKPDFQAQREAFEPRTEEERKYKEASEQTHFQGHNAHLRAELAIDIRQRYHPSVYPVGFRKAQAILARNINVMKQQLADQEEEDKDSEEKRGQSPTQSNQHESRGSGFVVRFTADGIQCSPLAESLARSYRHIVKKAAVSASTRPRSPLQKQRAWEGEGYFAKQVAVMNGPPMVTDSHELNASFQFQNSHHKKQSAADESPSRIVSADPVIEQPLGLHRRELNDEKNDLEKIRVVQSASYFGDLIFDKSGNSGFYSPDSRSRSVMCTVDPEAKLAVDAIAETIFSDDPSDLALPSIATDASTSVPGVDAPSKAAALCRSQRIATFRNQVLLASNAADTTQNPRHQGSTMPLPLQSFLSFKNHEASGYGFRLKGEHAQSGLPSAGHTDRCNSTENSHRTMTSIAMARSPSLCDRTRISPSRRSASALAYSVRPTSSALHSIVDPAAVPRSVAARRCGTPSSRPHGTLLLSMNATDTSPSATAFAPPATTSVKTSHQWLSMTQTVRRTQKYIDDAVRIHNAQSQLKELLDDRLDKNRAAFDLRQRAADKTFEDEMANLKLRISDPLQRTMLVSDWIRREPPRRLPDREKHSSMLRGTILAEEAQHTSLMVREGLKKLEHTFARRKRFSSKN